MSQANKTNPPLVLCILDGFGVGTKSKYNAVSLAKMPTWNRLWRTYPHTTLDASGPAVGLPLRQAGNSEAGHINLGAGRIVKQDSVRILDSIRDGTFVKNAAFIGALKHIREHNSKLHLMGLLCSDQSGHAHPKHLQALLDFCRQRGIKKVCLHLFTDGRDSPPHSALGFLRRLRRQLKNGEVIASIIGRFYAMDRNKRWERTAAAYDAMTRGIGHHVTSAEEALTQAYDRGESDEYIAPSVVYEGKNPTGLIGNGDAVIFFNLRSDRARQMTKPFVQPQFEKLGGFTRSRKIKQLYFVALTDFGPDLDTVVTAFPSADLEGTLPAALIRKRQLYIAESEKYAHITYFFNGGHSDPVAGEERLMIPSPRVAHYDLRPAMSARAITAAVSRAIRNKQVDFVAMNFANPDMVGHTGNILAAAQALKVVDQCLQTLYNAVVIKQHGTLIITSDHGNCELMIDPISGAVLTEHTSNRVPFVIVQSQPKHRRLRPGVLADVAPTILALLAVPSPAVMTHWPLWQRSK